MKIFDKINEGIMTISDNDDYPPLNINWEN